MQKAQKLVTNPRSAHCRYLLTDVLVRNMLRYYPFSMKMGSNFDRLEYIDCYQRRMSAHNADS